MIKEKILLMLKGSGLLDSYSTTRISCELHESYWKVVRILELMEQDGLIVKINKGQYQTFWRIK